MTWILEKLSNALCTAGTRPNLNGWLLALSTLVVVGFVSLAYGSAQDLYNLFILNSVGFGAKQLTGLDLLLLVSAVWSIFLCLMLSLRVYSDNVAVIALLYLVIFFSLVACILSTSLFAFFWFYEMLLLASAYLVLMSSPNNSANNVALYFLFWTQAGSFVLFCSVAFIVVNLSASSFIDLYSLKTSNTTLIYLSSAVFLAFGINLPIWPFHFWLTKTHVEANTGFSIFLSGVLVNVAVLGLYKFAFFFFNGNLHLFMAIAVFGLVDSSIKLCLQQDLNNIIAMATVFEMNQLLCCMLLCSTSSVEVVNLFILFHTFISASFFYLVEIIYLTTRSSTTNGPNNLLDKSQPLALILIFFTLLFIGLPATPKFFIELVLFSKLADVNFILLVVAFTSILVFYVAFVSFFFVLLFGTSLKEAPNAILNNEWLFNFSIMALSLTLICFLF